MAESAADPEVFWVRPETRGIIPLDGFHVPKSLAKTIRKNRFDIRFDSDFEASSTAAPRRARSAATPGSMRRSAKPMSSSTGCGHCHSVEAWREERLVGGLYGVSLGRAFFGESMFSARRTLRRSASCIWSSGLNARGFALLDTQFTTEHLKRFGAVDVPRGKYEKMLAEALEGEAQLLSLTAGNAVSYFAMSPTSPSASAAWNIIFQPLITHGHSRC